MVDRDFVEQDPAPGLDDRWSMSGHEQAKRPLRDPQVDGGLGEGEQRRGRVREMQFALPPPSGRAVLRSIGRSGHASMHDKGSERTRILWTRNGTVPRGNPEHLRRAPEAPQARIGPGPRADGKLRPGRCEGPHSPSSVPEAVPAPMFIAESPCSNAPTNAYPLPGRLGAGRRSARR